MRANTEQLKRTPWFAKSGAACSIVPIARFISPSIFALKGGGYGCLFTLTGIDEEGLTDQELDARMRSIEGALHGLPEGSCLYQYIRIMAGFELPRQDRYSNPVTQVFADDRLAFLERTGGFRRIDLHWCLTLEPSRVKVFERKPKENADEASRMLSDLQKTATILEGHLGGMLGLRLLGKNGAFQFFSYLFNLEEWAAADQLRDDTGVDRQIVKSPVTWHSDHIRVGKRHVQMFSLKTTPEASRPCLFSGVLTLDCDSILCSPRNILTGDRGFDSSTASVAEDHDHLGSEDSGAEFETADDLGRGHIASYSGNEDVSDGLVEDSFYGHARVSAGEDGSERFLLLDGVVTQDLHVLVEAGDAAGDVAFVAVHEGLEGLVSGEIALGEDGLGAEKAHRGGAGEGSGRSGDGRAEESAAGRKWLGASSEHCSLGVPPYVVTAKKS